MAVASDVQDPQVLGKLQDCSQSLGTRNTKAAEADFLPLSELDGMGHLLVGGYPRERAKVQAGALDPELVEGGPDFVVAKHLSCVL